MKIFKSIKFFVLSFLFIYPSSSIYAFSESYRLCDRFTAENIANSESYRLCDGFTAENITDKIICKLKEQIKEHLGYDIEELKRLFDNNEYIRVTDLSIIYFSYYGFDGKVYKKFMVVNKAIAREVLEILKELYDNKYPINNISCFNYRNMTDSNKLSWHALGLAIDINYQQNPYVKYNNQTGNMENIVPKNCEKYLDRNIDEKGMIKVGDACHKAFKSRGWTWGGEWTDPIDYMHFQKFPTGSKPEAKYKKA